ncbi:MAG TPA: hypothetical protein VKZ79_11925 [Alphaproteobacteria bacterium]|nr:hypothetical protein [Alphaproteobacteria bacterium]
MISSVIWGLVVLVIVICSFITQWVKINAENDRKMKGGQAANAELEDSIRRLEQRVANLERAVTTAESERKFAL